MVEGPATNFATRGLETGPRRGRQGEGERSARAQVTTAATAISSPKSSTTTVRAGAHEVPRGSRRRRRPRSRRNAPRFRSREALRPFLCPGDRHVVDLDARASPAAGPPTARRSSVAGFEHEEAAVAQTALCLPHLQPQNRARSRAALSLRDHLPAGVICEAEHLLARRRPPRARGRPAAGRSTASTRLSPPPRRRRRRCPRGTHPCGRDTTQRRSRGSRTRVRPPRPASPQALHRGQHTSVNVPREGRRTLHLELGQPCRGDGVGVDVGVHPIRTCPQGGQLCVESARPRGIPASWRQYRTAVGRRQWGVVRVSRGFRGAPGCGIRQSSALVASGRDEAGDGRHRHRERR